MRSLNTLPNKEPVTIDKAFRIIPILPPQYYLLYHINNKGGNTKILSY